MPERGNSILVNRLVVMPQNILKREQNERLSKFRMLRFVPLNVAVWIIISRKSRHIVLELSLKMVILSICLQNLVEVIPVVVIVVVTNCVCTIILAIKVVF